MAAPRTVTPNRRGVKSRALVLDAAERVMATHGFDGATVARVVEEAGIPMSSLYHYYGSKDQILLAVMERGADRFFDDLPRWDQRMGRPGEHLARVVSATVATLERHPDFLRLLIVLATQPPAGCDSQIAEVIGRIRRHALQLLRAQIAIAFDDDPHDPATDQLARFALAAIDGAFVASQVDSTVTLSALLDPLAPALTCYRRARRAGQRSTPRRGPAEG